MASKLLQSFINRRRTRNYDIGNTGLVIDYLQEYLTPIGTVIAKISDNSPGDMWLKVENQWLSKTDYADLYADIGGQFGETDDTFRLPNMDDCYLIGAGTDSAGQSVGANDLTLTESQIPSHTHGVTDPGHTHTFTGTPHSHTVTDPGHTHAVDHAGASADAATGSDEATAESGGTSGSATTGVTVDQATAGGTNQSATTGVTVGSTGGGQSFDNRPKSVVMHYFIKARI